MFLRKKKKLPEKNVSELKQERCKENFSVNIKKETFFSILRREIVMEGKNI
jgi:hypothetical protein